MALYVTLKCDGTMPPGSRERCRAGFPMRPRIFEDDGGPAIDVLAVQGEAQRHGWGIGSSTDADGATRTHDYCPACARHRRAAL